MKLIKKVIILMLLSSLFLGADEKININFKDLKINDLVKITAKILDKNVLSTYDIKGKVDFISNKPVAKEELVKILFYVLESKGYTLVDNRGILRIIKLNESARNNLPVKGSNYITNYNQMITEVFKVKGVNVDFIASKVRHLISKSAKLVTNKDSNTLALTDFQDNISTVKKVINIMTADVEKTIKVIELKNIVSLDAKKNLDAISKALFNQKIETEKLKIIANKENNSIVLIGNKSNVDYMKNHIEKMDANESLIKRIVEVYPLKNVEATNVIKIIDGIVGKKKYIDPEDKPLSSVDEETNSIVLMGPSDEVEYIKQIIKELDKEKAQVYVLARIIELNDDLVDEVGIKYGILGGKTTSSGLGTFASSLNEGSALSFNPKDIGLTIPNLSSGLALGASISLLNQDGALEIISEPSILAINNKESSIYVGETISVKTSSTTTDGGNTNDNFQREDVGLTLKVKPRISNDNKVTLDLTTIQENVKTTDTTSGNADTSKKEITTTAIVNNGESVIIGGLIEDKEESTQNKIPLLGDIPLVGLLFKHDRTDITKQRLVIVVTPYIIPKSKDISYVRDQLSQLKMLEEKYLTHSLIRLKKAQAKQKEEDKKHKEQLQELDDELETTNKKIKPLSTEEAHKQRVKKMFGI